MPVKPLMVLGCDPGSTGALCVLTKDWVKTFRFTKFQYEEAVDFVNSKNCNRYKVVAGIERVGSRTGNSMQSVFAFGVNTGYAYYTFNRIGFKKKDVLLVESKDWQRHFGLGWNYGTTTLRKNAHVAKAREIWPNHKITQEEADAWLIARYFWNMEVGL